MVMINVTPRKPSIVGMVIGAVLFIVGVWLISLDWNTLLTLIKLFAGFFLVMLGIGIFSAALARRRYR